MTTSSLDATADKTGARIAKLPLAPTRFGLAFKIAGWATVFGTAIVVTIGAYIYRASVQVLLDREQAGLTSAIDRTASRLDLLLATARQDVTFLSRVPPVAGIMRATAGGGVDVEDASSEDDWKDRLAEILAEVMRAKPEYLQMRFIGVADGGREIVRIDRLNGSIIRAAEAQLQPRGDQPYFQALTALPAGSVHVSKIEPNREAGEIETRHRPTLQIATPVLAPFGGPFGIVIARIDMDQLFDSASRDLGGASRLFVTDDSGDYLVQPDKAKAFGLDLDQSHRLQDDYPDLAGLFAADGDHAFNGFVASPSGGELASTRRVYFDPADRGRYLVMAAFATRDTLLAGIAALRRSTFMVAIALIVGGALVALFMAGVIIKPLRKMTEAAASLASGNRNVDLADLSGRGDETGDLARAFSAMTRQIVGREQELIEQAEALAESAQSFRATVETSPNGLIIVDSQGRIELVNGEVERLFGYDRAELIGQSLEVLLPEKLRERHCHLRARFVQAPSRRTMGSDFDLFGLRKDGTMVPIDVSLSPLQQKGRTMILAAIVDMTERRRFQQQLADRAKELQRSNAELAQFAYVASHDLQEPLRMVGGYLTLLSQRYHGKLDAEADEFIGFAVDGAARMKRLIDDLLGYSRTSKQPFKTETVDTGSVVSSVVATLAQPIDETGAEIACDLLPSVQGDAIQLERLFMRLIENALKYRSGAPPRIHVGATRQGAFWQFSVTDNGIGIDPRFKDQVFEIFKRLCGRDEYNGTGIGLAVCAMVVERHGGKIWVEPANGGGSVFNFTLPAVQ